MSLPYTNIKAPVSVVQNELAGEFIRRRARKGGGKGSYLAIGDGADDICEILAARRWDGIRVGTKAPKEIVRNEKYIRAYMAPDPRISRIIDGYYVRTLTVGEIFNQYPGPYDVISIIGSDMDREIWLHENILNHDPMVYALSEDGHNEQIIRIAISRGYEISLVEGILVMARSEE
tara:strand:- start:2144 stop:2671 length:528 start_codon:yes stop_codon:yes gene_type:complete